MNQITGKITLANTNTGIPNLLVVVYDVDPGTQPHEIVAALSISAPGIQEEKNPAKTKPQPKQVNVRSANDLGFIGDRLGSVLTGQDGAFSLTYEDAEFQIRDAREVRPDLFLMVFAPEQINKPYLETLLFFSPEIRQNAGRMETYYIQMTAEQLKGANLPTTIQSPESDSKTVVASILHNTRYAKDLSAHLVHEERNKQNKLDEILRKKVLPSLLKIKELPKNQPVSQSEAEKHVKRNLDRLNKAVYFDAKAKGIRIYVQVPDAEARRMQSASPKEFNKLIIPHLPDFDKLEVDGAVYRNQYYQTKSESPALFPDEDIKDEKVALKNQLSSIRASASEDAPVLSSEDIPKFIHRLLDGIVSPEDLLSNNNSADDKKRPDNASVLDNVSKLNLSGGPADVPAFYDFHSLHFAFPDVWQELIDNDVIHITETLLELLAEMGVDIQELDAADDVLALLQRQVSASSTASTQIAEFTRRTLEQSGEGARAYKLKNDGISVGNQKADNLAAANLETATMYIPETLTPGAELLQNLEDLLASPNKFVVFKEGIVNYGIMVSYRQKWTPLNYQVGDLVRSIPLSPKEVRKVTTKRVVKKDRTIKEMENNLQSRQDESTETGRTESEIVEKAQKNTAFSASASYTSSFGLTANAEFKTDTSKSSDSVKKNFREAVVKAAQEFKDERKLEVEAKESYEDEFTESTEISNPNDELTITYLFYELQRRYEVSEHLHKITPVVLVPMPMPNPNKKEITQLVLKHCWVINRVLLDDRFRPALNYMMSGMIGEEEAIKQMQATLNTIQINIQKLGNQIVNARHSVTDALEMVQKELEYDSDGERKRKITERERTQIENRKEAVERALQLEQSLNEKLAQEQAGLSRTSEALAQMKSQYRTRLFEIDVFRLHIKENIFYYMQAIWDYTHRDQLFMTFYDDIVPVIEAKEKTFILIGPPEEIPPSILPLEGHTILEVEVKVEYMPQPSEDKQFLIQVADLDRPLGYKGNYMIFPMRQPNALTEYMMTPYLDEELGLRDPDGLGHWTPEEFVEYVNFLRSSKTPEEFASLEKALSTQYGRILSASRRLKEEIIVPTDSLYIEALPGKHPLLEDFKLMHRAMDVQKVQAEVRALELENIRYAARLLSDEREDPRVEKKIVVEGNGVSTHLDVGGE